MLLSSNGVVQMEGTTVEIATELTGLLKGLMDKKVLSEKEIKDCLELALMSDEEVHKRVIAEMKKFLGEHKDSDTFKELFKDLLEDEE